MVGLEAGAAVLEMLLLGEGVGPLLRQGVATSMSDVFG